MSAYIGIDPGVKGGLAVIRADGTAGAWRYPGDMHEAARLLREVIDNETAGGVVVLAAIEKVSAMPRGGPKGEVKMGASSAFKFGGNYYGWMWAMSALMVPYTTVTPQKWQKALLDSGTGETKERSLNMARRLFPGVDLRFKVDDGKADALHLARWARMQAEKETA